MVSHTLLSWMTIYKKSLVILLEDFNPLEYYNVKKKQLYKDASLSILLAVILVERLVCHLLCYIVKVVILVFVSFSNYC